jgi:hypothetical protein
MRVFPRLALVVLLLCVFAAPAVLADQFRAACPLTLVATNPPASTFTLSPSGAFRSGSQVFVLRGQTLTTFTTTDLGDMQIAREDFIGSLGARETNGGVAFSNGILFVSSEAGLEIFDLRNVRAGGNAPVLISRTSGLHYRRLAVNGNTLAGLYPGTDLNCFAAFPLPFGQPVSSCTTNVDLFNIANLAAPVRGGTISTQQLGPFAFLGQLNDIAFNFGLLVVTGNNGTAAFNVNNPATPFSVGSNASQPGKYLVSNGTNLVGVGNDESVLIYTFNTVGQFTPFLMETMNQSLKIDRANPIMFHPQGAFNEAGTRLIMMVDEVDPQTLGSARTLAFDVFDFDTTQLEGSDSRIYETVSSIRPDEVKHNPLAVGPLVYTVGEVSGVQTWGACGQMTGRIELDLVSQLICGGTEIHGWVTGDQKIANVELFIDGGSLGAATLGSIPRNDVDSRTPVQTWRVSVNLDTTVQGFHLLRAVGTDTVGNRRQFASQPLNFPGPPLNCTARRRNAASHF